MSLRFHQRNLQDFDYGGARRGLRHPLPDAGGADSRRSGLQHQSAVFCRLQRHAGSTAAMQSEPTIFGVTQFLPGRSRKALVIFNFSFRSDKPFERFTAHDPIRLLHAGCGFGGSRRHYGSNCRHRWISTRLRPATSIEISGSLRFSEPREGEGYYRGPASVGGTPRGSGNHTAGDPHWRISTADGHETAALEAQLLRDRFAGSEARLQEGLDHYGLTREELRAQLLWQLTVLDFIDQRFRAGVSVSDEAVRAYYDQHTAELLRQYPQSANYEAVEQHIRTPLEAQDVDQKLQSWLMEARNRARIEYIQGVSMTRRNAVLVTAA